MCNKSEPNGVALWKAKWLVMSRLAFECGGFAIVRDDVFNTFKEKDKKYSKICFNSNN